MKELKQAQRELLPPAVRVQAALHPWVAYGVMPLFALANAGIALNELDVSGGPAAGIALGVFVALVFGKPLGVVFACWLVVRLGWSRLPDRVSWRGVLVVGCLAGIGFTMAIFIATLAFAEDALLGAAKLGVLAASATAGVVGLVLGRVLIVQPARRSSAREAAILRQDHGLAGAKSPSSPLPQPTRQHVSGGQDEER